jgi:formate dehydrogenase iron-sulfur subunit
MKHDRRKFLQIFGVGGLSLMASPAEASEGPEVAADTMGCLVDLSQCEGCRKCEAACNTANDLPPPESSFDDKAVLDEARRPSAKALTVVNRYDEVQCNRHLGHAKIQCMHCLDPACVSACIVGALTKDPDGPVLYDASLCIGCRYCMVACPFGIPAYEYGEVLTPRVMKCEFCASRLEQGEIPACAAACPKEAITFGVRSELLTIARERINGPQAALRKRDPLVNHIYGEQEVGGTSWLYLATVPFKNLGFLDLPDKAPPRLTETIQHSIFKHFVPPASLFALLGAAMLLLRPRRDEADGEGEEL